MKLLSKSQIFLKVDIQIYMGMDMQNFCFRLKIFARLIFLLWPQFFPFQRFCKFNLYCIKFLSELFAVTIQQQIQISWIQFLLLVDFWIMSNVIYLNDCLQWYVSSGSVISFITYLVPPRFGTPKTRVEIKLGVNNEAMKQTQVMLF